MPYLITLTKQTLAHMQKQGRDVCKGKYRVPNKQGGTDLKVCNKKFKVGEIVWSLRLGYGGAKRKWVHILCMRAY